MRTLRGVLEGTGGSARDLAYFADVSHGRKYIGTHAVRRRDASMRARATARPLKLFECDAVRLPPAHHTVHKQSGSHETIAKNVYVRAYVGRRKLLGLATCNVSAEV